ncbi:MAG: NTP transferase domain-containing protein [Sporichthyaceae bacterium]|nr:NTP transferase domain-containing protein [Sporichthyaceae bacterium]
MALYPQVSYDAIVLAGGAGRRLGGLDKSGLEVGGRTLLDRAVAACGAARRVVVVGPDRPTSRPVRWAREQPVGGGPVAATAAGLAQTGTDVVVLLAVDTPFVTAATLDRLVAAVAEESVVEPTGPSRTGPGPDGAILVGADGRDQPLVAAYRRAALIERLAELGDPAGIAVSRLVGGLDLVRLPDQEAASMDCDTWDELEHARAWARASGGKGTG